MMSYFRPLKRKIGVVKLAVACVFMLGWMRSFAICDMLQFGADNQTTHIIYSSEGLLTWRVAHLNDLSDLRRTPLRWVTDDQNKWNWYEEIANEKTVWCLHQIKFGFGHFGDVPESYSQILIVPYWLITVPLTLLSSYLLLSKPRTNQSKPTTTQPAM